MPYLLAERKFLFAFCHSVSQGLSSLLSEILQTVYLPGVIVAEVRSRKEQALPSAEQSKQGKICGFVNLALQGLGKFN
ncbi:hypothetical protein CEXT_34071 [Caerostris extrusa]|uniref:Uncharacterized protein n=1 Tax=Caerostris extrusa TaxID=172846 RepID=A0AAV4P1E8_CAEEX|nr:hypothetical protein CEXT_34071 [Caerostris extrusa]